MKEPGITSFVLRFAPQVWTDVHGDAHLQWRGQIRHVQGDDEAGFTDLADALAFMQRHLVQLARDSLQASQTPVDQNKVLGESFKLWEKFAASYSGLMFEALERTLEQSAAIQERVDAAVEQALYTWRRPAPASPAQIAEAMDKLQAQVKALAARIDQLEKTRQTRRADVSNE